MTDEPLDALLARVARSSNRMRIAMAVTTVLCALLVAGIVADDSLWSEGLVWRIGGAVGIAFFAAVAAVMAYGTFWRQQRHIARLRRTLREDPHAISSIRLLVARTVPVVSWSPDDGSARTGLHISVDDDHGHNWLLPVSRAEAATMVAELRRRCPRATSEPE
ncbi:MAG: hypothetical protein WCJ53_00800 [Mycobacteriaceae bacterium]